MRIIITAAIITIVGLLLGPIMPWWSIMLVAFLVGFIFCRKGKVAAFGGFIGGMTLWFGYAFLTNWNNNSVLGDSISELLGLSNAFLLVFVVGLLGGVLALSGAVTGYNCMRLFRKNRKGRKYQ